MLSYDGSAIEEIIRLCENDLAQSTKIKNGIDYSVKEKTDKEKEAASFLFNLNIDLNKIISVLDQLKLNKNSIQNKLNNAIMRIEELEAQVQSKDSDIFSLQKMLKEYETKVVNMDKVNNKNQNYIDELLLKLKISNEGGINNQNNLNNPNFNNEFNNLDPIEIRGRPFNNQLNFPPYFPFNKIRLY